MLNARSFFHRSKSIFHLGLKIWDIVVLTLKELTSVVAFKKDINKWKQKSCPCRLCKKYISNLGYMTVLYEPFLTFYDVLKIHCI